MKRMFFAAIVLWLLSGCTRAAAFAPAAIPLPTGVVTPVPIRPSTATPLPLGRQPVYVVDPRDGNITGQVLAIDPDARRIVRTIPTRYAPEIAISPDGQKLYIVDSYSTRVIRGDPRDVLSVYGALTGELLHDDVDIPGRLLYKLFPDGHPLTFLSQDGRRLFVGKYGSPDIHALRMTVLDAETFRTLAEYARPECDLLPLHSGGLLCVSSGQQPRLVDPLTGQTTDIPVSLPAAYRAAVVATAADRLYLAYSDAQSPANLVVLDLSPARVTLARVALSGPLDSEIRPGLIAVAPNESRLYIGFVPNSGELADRGLAAAIWGFDTKSGARLGGFALTRPAWHFALSADGMQLYTVNPFDKSFSILDTADFREIATMRDLGDTPANVVVPFTSR